VSDEVVMVNTAREMVALGCASCGETFSPEDPVGAQCDDCFAFVHDSEACVTWCDCNDVLGKHPLCDECAS
jgi:hypothetical protein